MRIAGIFYCLKKIVIGIAECDVLVVVGIQCPNQITPWRYKRICHAGFDICEWNNNVVTWQIATYSAS